MSTAIQSKLPKVGTTIFTVMSALAAEHKAINLGQGFPDFEMSHELIELVSAAMRDGHNQYVPMQGYLPLRQQLSKKVQDLYNCAVNPDTEITITPGGTYAIYTALTCLLKPGDEVIVFEPAYDSYIPNIELNGAKAVRINLRFPGYTIDWEAVSESITDKTRAILLNSPHNPTGSVLTANDVEALRKIVRETSIIIISDEVYEHLVFDGWQHQSMLRFPDLLARSFVCFSFGKLFHCTGWKLGYCIAPSNLMQEFRKVHQFNCFSCNSPAQVGIAAYLRDPASYSSLSGFMQEKRDYFIQLMGGTRFTLLPTRGSYFICATYEKISDEAAIAFSTRLTREVGVASIPVSAFYQEGIDNKVIRFCFAKQDSTLEQAVSRLALL